MSIKEKSIASLCRSGSKAFWQGVRDFGFKLFEIAFNLYKRLMIEVKFNTLNNIKFPLNFKIKSQVSRPSSSQTKIQISSMNFHLLPCLSNYHVKIVSRTQSQMKMCTSSRRKKCKRKREKWKEVMNCWKYHTRKDNEGKNVWERAQKSSNEVNFNGNSLVFTSTTASAPSTVICKLKKSSTSSNQ